MKSSGSRSGAVSRKGSSQRTVHVGSTRLCSSRNSVTGRAVVLLGQEFYQIGNVDRMTPFFMTLVSDSNHWAFLASNGGITAGRVNANQAIFPYYTDDKIREGAELTGGKTLIRVRMGAKECLWEPLSSHLEGIYRTQRNLYKNSIGNAVVFEEINHDLGLVFRSAWRSSDRYGWVRTVWIRNMAKKPCRITVLDGLQNVIPWGVTPSMQNDLSTLIDAYKRSELDASTGLGIFALSSILTDSAEPSEALKATTVWQQGLAAPRYTMSSCAIEQFRKGYDIEPLHDARGVRGAYLAESSFPLAGGAEREWSMVADVARDHAAVASLRGELKSGRDALHKRLMADIERGHATLTALVAGVDGLQYTADRMMGIHHFANTLFNAMRGGTFMAGYSVKRDDLGEHVKRINRPVFERYQGFFRALPEELDVQTLLTRAAASGSPDLERLCGQYLPISFSRRHGDPSRPWNVFTIQVRKPDGSQDLHYEGNWRDIFQNWEALGYSYPAYIEGFVRTFLSATTADGYNPYRITNHGIDWEKPEPGNPWANFGYWSDHQLIYLQKLLEALDAFTPNRLAMLLDHAVFSHANIPYRIKDYASLVHDARSSLEFDYDGDRVVGRRVKTIGADGRLILDKAGRVVHVSLMEKSLILILAKLTNLVPEGGIWMNTQRPEWNDANNALVGKGLSMVTVSYLHRFAAFLSGLLSRDQHDTFAVATEVGEWFEAIDTALKGSRARLAGGFTPASRRRLMDALGEAGSNYRLRLYARGLSGRKSRLARRDIEAFLLLVSRYLEQTIRSNRRQDGLYHSYNILHLSPGRAGITRLDEMLEGQVAVLSSGLLKPAETLKVLKAMRASQLYRADQNSYMLYPNRLPLGFLARNRIASRSVVRSGLLSRLVKDGDVRLIVKDADGACHFNGNFHNERDLAVTLEALKADSRYAGLAKREEKMVRAIFEETFNHSCFTGRAGSFFAYEGIGSIYWHMVAKLLLAVQENHARAVRRAPPAVQRELARCYYDIRAGLGFNKSPDVYGAFPSDPYSHTPWGKGARQPGMTGQVKEELLTRAGELGIEVRSGLLAFTPRLLRHEEWLTRPATFTYYPVRSAHPASLAIPRGGLAFTVCQIPVVYRRSSRSVIKVRYADGTSRTIAGSVCDAETSKQVFSRSGTVKELHVAVVA